MCTEIQFPSVQNCNVCSPGRRVSTYTKTADLSIVSIQKVLGIPTLYFSLCVYVVFKSKRCAPKWRFQEWLEHDLVLKALEGHQFDDSNNNLFIIYKYIYLIRSKPSSHSWISIADILVMTVMTCGYCVCTVYCVLCTWRWRREGCTMYMETLRFRKFYVLNIPMFTLHFLREGGSHVCM